MARDHDRSAATGAGSGRMAERFGDYLRQELRARTWTIRYCALQSGLDHSTISRLMKGRRMPSLGTARRLDEALNGASSLPDAEDRQRAADADPRERVADALRHDPLLDRQSIDLVLRYYAHVRSQGGGPGPR